MAHKKAGGSTQLGRDSRSQRLGLKRHDGQRVNAGEILVRQRGTGFHAGKNVMIGSDDTLYSAIAGVVKFSSKKTEKWTGKLVLRKFVNVEAVIAK